MVRRIVSGGQTGADRGALDAAIELGIEHGGYCPGGRRAEDGRIPAHYNLVETGSRQYPERTRRNVIESDGTLVVTRGAPTGGTALTVDIAQREGRPLLLIDLADPESNPDSVIRRWLEAHRIEVLNVAGPRASGASGIAEAVHRLLVAVLA
jgi:hypothetical protein